METLSVIIPVYNREELIGRVLDSVYVQTLLPQRLIIVDNASTDSTRSCVESWIAAHKEGARKRGMEISLLDERTPGASPARNRGLKEVDTEWTMFFDSDDEMLPGHIERAMGTASSHPGSDIVGWDVSIELPGGGRRSGRFTTEHMPRNNLVHAIMATQRYMARTSLFRRVGGWNEEAMVWNDWELGIRLLHTHPRVVKAEGAPTVRMHFTPVSITGTRRHADRCRHTLAIAERTLRKEKDQELLLWLDYRRAVLAAECERQGDRVAARAFLDEALSGRSAAGRMAIRLVYLHAKTLKRGAYLTFRLLGRL